MPYYLKMGALYQTSSGAWTWAKSGAKSHESPQGKPPIGCFWSRETPADRGEPCTRAAKHEAILTSDLSKQGEAGEVLVRGRIKPLREWQDHDGKKED